MLLNKIQRQREKKSRSLAKLARKKLRVALTDLEKDCKKVATFLNQFKLGKNTIETSEENSCRLTFIHTFWSTATMGASQYTLNSREKMKNSLLDLSFKYTDTAYLFDYCMELLQNVSIHHSKNLHFLKKRKKIQVNQMTSVMFLLVFRYGT